MVVLLKLLSKNDETTKSKALEELQTRTAGVSEVEEAVLAAWVRFPFPSAQPAFIVAECAGGDV
jgi:hypothetical protein